MTWVVSENVDTTAMDIIQVDKSFPFEKFFGYEPEGAVPDGEYAYLYGDCVLESDVKRLLDDTEDQPYVITTKEEDRKNGGLTVIWLFKLEE